MTYAVSAAGFGRGEPAMKCSVCAEENAAHANYCVQCGSPFDRPAPVGERRRVSVMFADIASSTALIAGRDPEDARAILDSSVRTMTAAVYRFGGMVTRIAGDGIVALFGAPVAYEDHAVRACLAALRIQADVSAVNDDATAAALAAPVRVRIGISSGEVLVRIVASDMRNEYAAEGPTTHLAAKAEQAARPGSVLVTAEVMHLAQGYIEARRHAPMVIAGLATPVEVFELVGVTGVDTRFQVATRRGLARFEGRDQEVAQLERAAELAAAGDAQARGVFGDAGVGKTRLIWEFRQRLRARRWDVFAARSTAYGVRSAYFPILMLVRAMYDIEPADTAVEVGHKLLAFELGDTRSIDLPPLLALLGHSVDEARWNVSDPKERRTRTRDALFGVLTARARERPTAIVIEDLHWADSETGEFVRWMIGELDRARLLVLLECRPEYASDIATAERFEPVRLGPLPESVAAALFADLAGSDPSLARLETRLLARVAGNPFFMEESIRMLCDTGMLTGDAGGYRLGRAGDPITIPDTVMEVLAARIAGLGRPERELAQLAAVIGKNIHMPALRALSGLDLAELHATLQRLVQAELLHESGIFPEVEYSFRHAFTHEVAYAGMLKKHRKHVHSQLVDLLESLAPDALAERVELLAHHALSAERWDEAIVHLQHAAERAFERSAMREAVRLLDEALRIVGQASAAVNAIQTETDLRLALRGPLVALGNVRRVGEELRRADALTAGADDPVRRCRVLVYVCGDRWFAGAHAAAIDAGRQALAIAESSGGSPLLVPLRQYLGGALHALGEHAAAQEMLSANVREVAEDAPGHRFGMAGLPAVLCRATRCWSLEHLGDFEAAAADAADALRIARASGHGFSIQGACFAAGNLHLSRGEYAQARRILEEGLAIGQAARHRMWVPLLGPLLALSAAGAGDPIAAADIVDRTVPSPDEPALTTFTRLAVAEAYAWIGRHEAAARQAQATLLRARERGERIWEAEASYLLGRIAEAPAEPDLGAAAAHYALALEGAQALRMRPLQGRCLLGLADTSARRGMTAQAVRDVDQACTLFETMALPYWLTRAQDLRRRIVGGNG